MTAPATGAVGRRTDMLVPIDLDELAARAALQTRRDRKYLVTRDELDRWIDAIADADDETIRVLEIDGRRSFGYRSVYFDTPNHDSYLAAARRRPHRWKVRTRTYVEPDTSWIEVKLRDGRRRTVKHRRSHDPARPHVLTPESAEFVSRFPIVRRAVIDLRPALVTEYVRTTLLVGDQRVTIDAGVVCAAVDGTVTASVGDRLVLETKSIAGSGPADRALWSLGLRPERFSKFAVGTAVAHPELPANRWRRTIARHVVVR